MSARERAAEVVRNGSRFLLTCHVCPDADALGSMLGLGAILRVLGKDVYLYNQDPIPEMLGFLPGAGEVCRALPSGKCFDGTFVTDTAARNLLPSAFPPPQVSGPVVIIDHHVAHGSYGDIILRDTNACATALVVLELASELGVSPIPAAAAMPLYTAIVADTGGFRYPGTSATTLRIAADLIDTGIDPWQVASNVFENWPMARLRLLGSAIGTLETALCGRVAFLCIPLSIIKQVGATDRMVEGMVEYGRMLSGVEIAVMLWEKSSGTEQGPTGTVVTRLSIRSAGRVDVASLAQQLGGGGHRFAAGAILHCDLQTARRRVLEAVVALFDVVS